ncbi:hypothetical protein BJ912DRAFT_952861 [Pholiota molesta]|nr:hypothetical protein BJ912DRAFT_952861 [Pholiota molesta]
MATVYALPPELLLAIFTKLPDPILASHPLSATLATSLFDPPLTFSLDAIRLLLLHADRWDTLTLALPLSLTLGNWRGDSWAPITAALFARTPALRTLAWSNHREWGAWDKPFASGIACAEMRVAWRGLTALVLDTHIDLDGALDVLVHALAHLSEAPDGVVLTIGENGMPLRERYSFAAPLLLPHLRTLHTFSLALDAALPDLLNCIVCPAINDLSITLGSTPTSGDFAASCPVAGSALVDCLTYASTTLERLEVYESEQRALHVAVLCQGLHTLVLRRVVVCADGALARTQASEESNLNEPKVAVARLRHVDVSLNATDIAYLRSGLVHSGN